MLDHDGRYDPNGVRREFLLLHDVYNGPKDFDEARALQRMRDRFGPGLAAGGVDVDQAAAMAVVPPFVLRSVWLNREYVAHPMRT